MYSSRMKLCAVGAKSTEGGNTEKTHERNMMQKNYVKERRPSRCLSDKWLENAEIRSGD